MKKTMQVSNKLLLASGAALFLLCASVGAGSAHANLYSSPSDMSTEYRDGDNSWAERHARWERRAMTREEMGSKGPVSFRPEDRAEIRGSIASAYRMSCPGGNSRSNTSVDCMLPWQSRADFIGEPVSMTAMPISNDLASRISPPPAGYHYAKSGTDVMLVNDNNGQIADIVTLYSAMHVNY